MAVTAWRKSLMAARPSRDYNQALAEQSGGEVNEPCVPKANSATGIASGDSRWEQTAEAAAISALYDVVWPLKVGDAKSTGM
ncbi:hypothetical protein ACWDRB_47435 [Nonomuraea sp. NPDC003707]